ncbi:hypothetical protein BDV39DRAFT_70213 [Aspergillus sergii]|uniref:Uncharacterized protein n=1 Tax=Aspergillus sergii TaxID=1034303 RepID=A0A5N6X5I6_9EURO|nr:hypothetical protein BDV39DRAFT_70213 [Aspergillus sergii]
MLRGTHLIGNNIRGRERSYPLPQTLLRSCHRRHGYDKCHVVPGQEHEVALHNWGSLGSVAKAPGTVARYSEPTVIAAQRMLVVIMKGQDFHCERQRPEFYAVQRHMSFVLEPVGDPRRSWSGTARDRHLLGASWQAVHSDKELVGEPHRGTLPPELPIKYLLLVDRLQ